MQCTCIIVQLLTFWVLGILWSVESVQKVRNLVISAEVLFCGLQLFSCSLCCAEHSHSLCALCHGHYLTRLNDLKKQLRFNCNHFSSLLCSWLNSWLAGREVRLKVNAELWSCFVCCYSWIDLKSHQHSDQCVIFSGLILLKTLAVKRQQNTLLTIVSEVAHISIGMCKCFRHIWLHFLPMMTC